MASLISWLAYAGARKSDGTAVASGSVYFYQPDTTSTQVTVYADEDGLVARTQPVALDAGGRAEVYAKAAVRAVVLDSTGATVRLEDRANTVTASQVEIEQTGFTGTSLTTGAQVDGGRTDLSSILSAALLGLGSTNFQYQESTAATPRTFTAAVGLWVTPQDFGALGNDSADDTTALQNAINRCLASGKGLFIPSGIYRFTGPLTVTGATGAGLRIQGAGRSEVVLKNTSTTANGITVDLSSAIESHIYFQDFSITALTTSSGVALAFSNGDGPTLTRLATSLHRTGIDTQAVSFANIEDCLVTSTDNNAAGKSFRVGGTSTIYRCRATQTNGTGFSLEGTFSRIINGRAAITTGVGFSLASGTCSINQSLAVSCTTGYSLTAAAMAMQCMSSGCTTGYSLAANDTTATMCIATGSTTGFTVGAFTRCGCTLCISTDGGTADFATNAAATSVVEAGNSFTTRSISDTTSGAVWLGPRINGFTRSRVTNSAATVTFTPLPTTADINILVNTNTSCGITVAATSTTGLVDGQRLILIFENDQNTGAAAITWNAQYVGGSSGTLTSVLGASASAACVLTFFFVWRTSTAKWVELLILSQTLGAGNTRW